MSDDEFENLAPVSNAEKIVKHFTQNPKLKEGEKTLEQHLEYAFQMKQQKDEAEKEYKLSMEKIKDLMKVDSIKGKREIMTAGDFNLIVMKKAGNCKIDYERYIEEVVGQEANKELEKLKALVKEGKADSKYITVGKEVVSCELVKRTEQSHLF